MREFGRDFALAVAFQKEGMALIDMAARIDPAVRVFTLDTGRLAEETLAMIDVVRERYGINVEVVQPDAEEVRQMVECHGRDLFYESADLRRLCCDVRKVHPLRRKLAELRAWGTGLRREQSPGRAAVEMAEFVDDRLKLNPLAHWTTAELEEYTREHDVPEHPLYARGYTSIGCAPCTRAVLPGEDARAGRWWWEADGHKECGIHVTSEGVVRRG